MKLEQIIKNDSLHFNLDLIKIFLGKKWIKFNLNKDYIKTLKNITWIVKDEYEKTGIKLEIYNDILQKMFLFSQFDNINLFRISPDVYYLCQYLDLMEFDYGCVDLFNDQEIIDFMANVGIPLNLQKFNRTSSNLRNLDLNNVLITGICDNVGVRGTNFTGSRGAVINPQTVYEKDLFFTVLKDAIVVDDFKDVDTYYTCFDGAKFIDRGQYASWLEKSKFLNNRDKLLYFDSLWKESRPYIKKRNRCN